MSSLGAKTISDFGEQWTRYPKEGDGYYASTELLRDVLEPLVPLSSVRGARVAEIGSGQGRIVRMLLDAGAAHVTAVEPSAAMTVLQDNTRDAADKITYVHGPGEALPGQGDLDMVVSIGVLHHVPEPDPVVAQAYRALRPGGKLVAWLYGHEGNELYLAFVNPLRRVTTRLPHGAVAALSWGLWLPVEAYVALALRYPLPLHGYVRSLLGKVTPDIRRLIIYDQLRPAYAKYYRRAEAEALLTRAGFTSVRTHHRGGYSWTVVGEKPLG